MLNKKIVAVDPGYDRCGIAVLEWDGKQTRVLHSECIETSSKDAHNLRLRAIYQGLAQLLWSWKPDVFATETLFFSLNKKTAIKVAEARGVILLAATEFGAPLLELSPQAVKLSVTGRGNADKKAVQKMVSMILKIDLSKRLDDEIDAIAIGLAATEELRVKKMFA